MAKRHTVDVSMYWEHADTAELVVGRHRLSGSPNDVRAVLNIIAALQGDIDVLKSQARMAVHEIESLGRLLDD